MQEFKSQSGHTKTATPLQVYSIIVLVSAAYFSYSLILKIFTKESFLLYILWFIELINELLFLYWAKQGIFWAKVGSALIYGRLFRISIGLVTCQSLIVLIELAALRSQFRWQCGLSLVLRIIFYFLTRRCFYETQSTSHLNDQFEIPFFSYERLTESDQQEQLLHNFKSVSKELMPLSESQNNLEQPSKSPKEHIRGSFVFS